MAKSDALKIAQLQARTELTSQVLNLATDPIWSSIGGFCLVHKLRKENLVGPVADDLLYAGIIAINTGRSPALMDLAGKGLAAGATVLAAAGGAAAGVVAAKVVTGAGAKGIASGTGKTIVKGLPKALAEGGTTLSIVPVPEFDKTSQMSKDLKSGKRKWWEMVKFWEVF